jgi:hypothetical protein
MFQFQFIVLLPFIVSILVILNKYEGNTTSIDPNLEYMSLFAMCFVFVLCCSIKMKKVLDIAIDLVVYGLGILFNLLWYYHNKEREKTLRRDYAVEFKNRTDYYDMQSLLSMMLFVLLVNHLKRLREDYYNLT